MKDKLRGNSVPSCFNCLPECRKGGLLCDQSGTHRITRNAPGIAIHHKREVVKTVIYFVIGDVRTPGFIDTAQCQVCQQVIKAHYSAAVGGSEWIYPSFDAKPMAAAELLKA